MYNRVESHGISCGIIWITFKIKVNIKMVQKSVNNLSSIHTHSIVYKYVLFNIHLLRDCINCIIKGRIFFYFSIDTINTIHNSCVVTSSDDIADGL